MNVHLDPVWPWSRLWEIALSLPVALVALGAVVGLAGLAVPVLMARGRRATLYGALAALAAPLLLLGWHAWPFALSDARGAAGYGAMAVPLTLAWLAGMVLLLMGPGALAGMSLATYASAPGATPGKRRVVAGLRLAAFVLTMLAIARPSLKSVQREQADVAIPVLFDRSRSMTVQDEPGKRSRWEHALKQIEACQPMVERLRQQGVEVRWMTFAEDLANLDLASPGEASGRRTAIGGALRAAYEGRPGDQQVRAVVVISDGGENGNVPALEEARRWRLVPAPVHTFASGNPGTTLKQNDVAITSITTSPSPFVPVKGKLAVKVLIDARGYEGSKARVRLFLETEKDGAFADREAEAKNVTLLLTTGNEVVLTTDAPDRAGEVKVKVVVDTAEKDDFPLNNTIETFVTVSKEGISVLLVDRQRAFEPQFICDALSEDLRFRVTPLWLRGAAPVRPGGKLISLDDHPYDAIILGDVTLEQLRSIDDKATEKIEKQVARGAGLMVLGGYVNLGAGDWGKDDLLRGMLPVELSDEGQQEKATRMRPTTKGLAAAPYILKLDSQPEVGAAWKKLASLDGYTKLKLRPSAEGKPGEKEKRTTEEVLARSEGDNDEAGDPLLVMKTYVGRRRPKGKEAAADPARVLVFAGDTTYRWVRDEEGQALHHRFWKQVVVWLARQEDAEGSVWVRPDVRRLPVRGDIGFQVGMRGKGGGPEVKDGKYTVEVVAPDGTKREVKSLSKSAAETRGALAGEHTRQPGIYQIVVKGEGNDPSGGKVSGQAKARVIVYDEDVEMQSAAANPAFLEKLAGAGEGEARRVEELATFFAKLAEQPVDLGRERWELRPDWATRDRSPFLVAFFLVFSTLVSLEWGLRRKWGMV